MTYQENVRATAEKMAEEYFGDRFWSRLRQELKEIEIKDFTSTAAMVIKDMAETARESYAAATASCFSSDMKGLATIDDFLKSKGLVP